ncbi:zinc ribbon domain-containing protein [Bremerella sp. T1]|uniref:hypothetical protein n=1 Tax=Bremerella sp. TYQ1 TaxID=3119568 RepID=UPI001CCFE38C|nr:hypothetical protein [Bremerella volcania]UBM34891.1 hypothetical protein LA756_19660 [Bremerella volcania]
MRLGPLLILLIFTLCVAGFGLATATPEPTFRVASGSMAPTLRGPHASVTCEQCQFVSILDGNELPDVATCSNCGHQENHVDRSAIRRGDALEWEEVAPDQLKRWDIVLLQNDQDAWQIKRVAFLPGETPRISAGELYQAQSIIEKTPQERESLKQLVFDHAFEAAKHPRFLSERASGSGWNVRPGTLGFAPISETTNAAEDWVVYHHERCLPPPSPVGKNATPLDSYGYNHSVSRELFPVADLWIEMKCEHWQADRLTIRVNGENTTATFVLDVSQQIVQCDYNDATTEFPLVLESLEDATIRAGECDGQLFFELETNRRHVRFPFGSAEMSFSNQPFAIKIDGGTAVLRKAKIYRDIVWLGAQRRPSSWSLGRKLEPHEIFVLGDNVPVSDDSRFELGPIDMRNNLRGKLLRVLAD